MLSTASSAVPRLMPAPIIPFSLTYKILIYETLFVNYTIGCRCPMANSEVSRLNGGDAGMRARGNGQESGFGFRRNFDPGMQEFCKSFNAGDEPRAGARKITIGFERIDTPIADGRHGSPLFGMIERLVFGTRL